MRFPAAVHKNFNAKLERMKEEKAEMLEARRETQEVKTEDTKTKDFRTLRKKKLVLRKSNNFATNY